MLGEPRGGCSTAVGEGGLHRRRMKEPAIVPLMASLCSLKTALRVVRRNGAGKPMSKDFITLRTFDNPLAAHMARNHLAEAGIRAFLANEGFVSTAWHLSNAAGGIHLQVGVEDAPRAAALLEARPGTEAMARPPESFEAATGEEDTPTYRERLADRALLMALIGILFFPLHLYAAWLLLKVIRSPEELGPAHRLHAIAAGVAVVPSLGLVVFWLCSLVV